MREKTPSDGATKEQLKPAGWAEIFPCNGPIKFNKVVETDGENIFLVSATFNPVSRLLPIIETNKMYVVVQAPDGERYALPRDEMDTTNLRENQPGKTWRMVPPQRKTNTPRE